MSTGFFYFVTATLNRVTWIHGAIKMLILLLLLLLLLLYWCKCDCLGYMTNNDVPMYIANCCGDNYFIGCLDEVRTNTFRNVLI